MSAQLDQETTDAENRRADHHLERCPACRSWWNEMVAVTRALRLRPVEPMPAVAPAVLARAGVRRSGWSDGVRYGLAVVAAVELVMAIPGVLLGAGASTVHDARHIGSFGMAIALGLLYVAWRPGRAAGILPIVAALAATMLASAVIDAIDGRVAVLAEGHHLLEVAGLVLVWLLAGRPLPRRRAQAPPPVPRRPAGSLQAS